MQDDFEDEPLSGLNDVHQKSPEMLTVNNNSCKNSRLIPKKSRQKEFALRRGLEKMSKKLLESNKKCDHLQKKFNKSIQKKKILRNSNLKLSRELKFLNKMCNNLRVKKSQMKKSCDKQLFSRLMKFDDRRRVFSKKYQFVTQHYRKNSKSVMESTTSFKRKELFSSVEEFFLDDENSSQAPGAAHFVVKKKVRKQKRYLTDTVQNLHKKYCKTIGKITRGLFYKLKP